MKVRFFGDTLNSGELVWRKDTDYEVVDDTGEAYKLTTCAKYSLKYSFIDKSLEGLLFEIKQEEEADEEAEE